MRSAAGRGPLSWTPCFAGGRSVVALAALVAGLIGTSTALGQTQVAVEYRHAGWNTYFVTAFADEIAALDGGLFGGVWKRTGQTFRVWSQPSFGLLPACRFFSTAFTPRSSHFYTPDAAECAHVKGDPNWQYESVAFHLRSAEGNGNCPAGTRILHRLYNDGMGGVPNHRYTTQAETLEAMRAAGWIPEGRGPALAFACVPPATLADAELPFRFRGATLGEWNGSWADPDFRGWQNIDEFARWGGNYLSLLIKPFYQGEPILRGQPLTTRLSAMVDKFGAVIEWAAQHGVYVSLRFHQISNWPRMPLDSWPDDGRSLWRSASAQEELIQAWSDLARRFKGNKRMLFNLFTEPQPVWFKDDVSVAEMVQAWNALYPRLIAAIRAVDPERWIVLEPNDPDAFDELVPSADPRVIYEFHFYYPGRFTCQGCSTDMPPAGTVSYPGTVANVPWEPAAHWDKAALEARLQRILKFRQTHDVRMIVGEFGSAYTAPMDSRVRWTADAIDLFEKHGLDWAYFTYDGMGWSGVGDDWGPWDFEGTPIEAVVTSRFGLNRSLTNPDGGAR